MLADCEGMDESNVYNRLDLGDFAGNETFVFTLGC
jgi:hypothetical protein